MRPAIQPTMIAMAYRRRLNLDSASKVRVAIFVSNRLGRQRVCQWVVGVTNCTDNNLADCDVLSNGCEIDLLNDNNNCGACGNACDLPNSNSSCNGRALAVLIAVTRLLRCEYESSRWL